jgi:hypothetical protein
MTLRSKPVERPLGDCIMSTLGFARRALTAACVVFAVAASIAGQHSLAQPRLAFRDIRVDVSPLRANAGDPTATWVQQELPARLADALAGRMARNGSVLVVRIDYLTLGSPSGAVVHYGSSPDNISGVAIIDGRQTPVRATTDFLTTPVAQTMTEESNRDRVSQLVQALVFWLSRDQF